MVKQGVKRGAPAPPQETKPDETRLAFELCQGDPVLGPVLELTRKALSEELQSPEVARLVGSAFYATGASEAAPLEGVPARATALLHALRDLGLVPGDAADLTADVFSRRIA